LRTGLTIQGLTTAAGLWLVAAIGLSAGAGMFAVSVVATLLGVLALTLLRRFEHKADDVLRRKISMVLGEDGAPPPTILAAFSAAGFVVSPAEYEKRLEERRVYLTVVAQIPADAGERLVTLLESQPGLQRVRVESVG
jgi:putative Mg2+ transporter-C (MgtC) family protein